MTTLGWALDLDPGPAPDGWVEMIRTRTGWVAEDPGPTVPLFDVGERLRWMPHRQTCAGG